MLVRSNHFRQASAGPSPAGHTRDAESNTTFAGAFDMRELLRILRWRGRLIAAVALGALAVTLVGLVVLPPKYKATTIVLLDPRQARVTTSEAVLSGIGADAAAVESQVEIIQSATIAKKVIAKLDLAADPEFASTSIVDLLKSGVASLVGLGRPETADAALNKLVYKFQTGLTVRRRGLTYILEVSYASRDAEKAGRISRAVADAYLDDQRVMKSDLTTRASGWLDDRLTEMRERLRRSEQAVADYKTANHIVDVTQGNKLVARQTEDTTQQLALARSRKAEARGRLDQVEEARRQSGNPAALAALNEVLQSQVITTMRGQYADGARLEAEYATLYGPKHPSLVAVRAQLADLRRQIDNEIGRVLEGVRNDYEVAATREASLEVELAKLKTQAETAGQTDVKLRELEREAEANRTLFAQFLSRAKETTEQQSLQIADARVVSPALTPIKPERPSAIVLLIVAAIAGIVFGVGLALLLEQFRRGVRNFDEAEQYLGLPGLGILPQQDAHSGARDAATQRSTAARHVLQFPLSDYAGGLWAIATRLRRNASALNKVLAVTSAMPGEGKSTFAANLALASAASGVRTLLIDGDIFAPATSKTFKLDGPGLCDVLDGKVDFWKAVSQDSESGLYLLGARQGAMASDQAREIPSRLLGDLLRRYRQSFDLIVIDGPAILPIDGGTFMECADQAVMVVEWERTERQAVLAALAMLGAERRKLAGVVLNKTSSRWYRLFDCGKYLRYYTPDTPTQARSAA